METRLKELLQEKGMMSKTLAEKMNLSEVSISALINGKTNNLETLAKAAECLGVEMWELFASIEDVINSHEKPVPTNTNLETSENLETRCPHCGELLHIKIY